MEIHIEIEGLCLFVRGAGNLTHLILPATHTGGSHEHVPHLEYDGHTGGSKMHGLYIDFSGVGGSNAVTWPLRHVLEVGALSGGTVHPRQYGHDPDQKVAAHITLPPPHQIKHDHTARWRVQGANPPVRAYTHRLWWIIRNVDHGTLNLRRKKFRDSNYNEALGRPHHTSTAIIKVTNKPRVDPTVCYGQPAAHAGMYYQFLGKSGPVPTLEEAPCLGDPGYSPDFIKKFESPTAFNCMLGQG